MAKESAPSRGLQALQSVDDFLHPQSMITPGIAGGLVTLIADAANRLEIVQPVWLYLGFSFLVGGLLLQTKLFRDRRVSLVTKGIYYLINSLIIFAMATGTGRIAETAKPTNPPAIAIFQTVVFASAQSASAIVEQDKAVTDWTYKPRLDAAPLSDSQGVQLKHVAKAEGASGRLARVFLVPKYSVTATVTGGQSSDPIAKVTYHLDPATFSKPKVERTDPASKFALQLRMRQEFTLRADVYFRSGKILRLTRNLTFT